MKDLYGIEEKKKSLLNRCYCTAKEYCGIIPVSGGIVLTGGVYTLLYTLGVANHITHDPADFLNASQYGEQLAAEWSKAAFPVGQFLTYTAKKRIVGAFNQIFGKGGDKHG